ncbi:MAG: hypothetical protein IJH00_02895 [Erysipelotrichaceae bacterium]|nr:hypothetical protein [Erysipelotrichaceae bacterium]
MEKIKKLFGGINLTWKKLIIFAVLAGVYTAIMAILPITRNTSFEDITVYFEVWILFGIIIIMNSTSPKDSALKCFVFFLISQPLVYLLQVPFSALGWDIFGFYRYWFIWTLLTIPMGYIGYYMKQDKWWGLLILTPILLLLGYHYANYLGMTIYFFPRHLLSAAFCFGSILLYPQVIFNDKKVKTIGLVISIVILVLASGYTLLNRHTYNTTLLVSNGEAGAVFDDTFKAYLEDERFGNVEIVYSEAIEDYMVNARIVKGGKTRLILEDSSGKKQIYDLDISYSTFDINKAQNS